MTIDHERITEKIEFMKNNLNKLKELADQEKKDFLNDYRNYDTAKYNLQATIKAMIDISTHIISRKEYGKPKTNADSFRILAENDVIEKGLLSTFVKMSKFRNRIVHLYDQIDEGQIYKILNNNLGDFDEFINIIVKKYL